MMTTPAQKALKFINDWQIELCHMEQHDNMEGVFSFIASILQSQIDAPGDDAVREAVQWAHDFIDFGKRAFGGHNPSANHEKAMLETLIQAATKPCGKCGGVE